MEAFTPKPLPLSEMDLNFNLYAENLIDAVSKLEVYNVKLNDSKLDTAWFLPTLRQKEALASTVLEGTQATLDGVLINQMEQNDADKNLNEVLNYFRASDEGYEHLKENKISLEFLKNIHRTLMSGNIRGKNTEIGEFRKKQNYIGKMNMNNAISYVPPVPEKVGELMENLISYINFPNDNLRPLVRIAIIHAQLETIHPFMDGNGRLGRILIPAYLYSKKQISEPCFFISEALEKDKFKYYSYLNKIRTHNRWSEWIDFFLKAVIIQCNKYIDLVANINNLYNSDLETAKKLAQSNKIIELVNLLYKFPIINSATIVKNTDLSLSTAQRYLNILVENKILYTDNKQRNKFYFYYNLLEIIRD